MLLLFACIIYSLTSTAQQQQRARAIWSPEKANTWYASQPWLVGANFLPSTAINQLEMWQAATFDTTTIARELKWASSRGMNTMRVFLHDSLYIQDPAGFKKRIDIFLRIAKRYGIRPLLLFFDSCWDSFPSPANNMNPAPSCTTPVGYKVPAPNALKDTTQYKRLEKYVKDIVSHFKNDNRILGWDVWNEPDNSNGNSYNRFEPYNKVALVLPLLKKVFLWCRTANPSQPLTSGIWAGNWSHHDSLRAIEKLMIEDPI